MIDNDDHHDHVDGEVVEEMRAAGDFSAWLTEVQGAIAGEGGSNVPCGTCTACCTASQFIHIAPDETDTLAHIPKALLFAAPQLPRGHVLMGYDERGHCPMLIENHCSIYDHRPQTCRAYDCRVFAAAGVAVDDDKPLIAEQARRWKFDYPAETDRIEHDAVLAAAAQLQDNTALLRQVDVPTNPIQLAVSAIEIHDMFLPVHRVSGEPTATADPEPQAVIVELTRRRRSLRRPS